MKNRRNLFLFILFGLLVCVGALTQWAPVQLQFETQKCIYFRNDHYSNIESLRGVPTYDEYKAESELMCRADIYYRQAIAVSQESMEEQIDDHTRMKIQHYYPIFASVSTPEREALASKALFYSNGMIDKHGDHTYRKNRAVMNIALGNYDLAKEDYGFFVEGTSPRSFWTLEDRAILYAHLGQNDKAVADYKNLLERVKHNPDKTSQAYIESLELAIVELSE